VGSGARRLHGEALEEIFHDRPVRRHPTAGALAAAIDRRGVEREPLETLVDARYRELVASPMDGKDALTWARDTGGWSGDRSTY